MKRRLMCLMSAIILLASLSPAQENSSQQMQNLEKKVDVLTQEIEKLKLGDNGPTGKGLEKVSIGGYGEFVTLKNKADMQRAVIYLGYEFNDWLHYNSEIEFEHGGSGEGSETRGEVEIEQAYLQAQPWKYFGARVGHLIVPLGLINENHEPTTFNSVSRPSVETLIIPSTWHENGIGILGEIGPVTYKSYALASLSAVSSTDPSADGFTASEAIRGGRTGGANSPMTDLAWASRIDLNLIPGLMTGVGLYLNRADHGSAPSSFPVTLWETHATFNWRGLSTRALFAQGRIGNADQLNIAQGFSGDQSVASRFFGGYAEIAFDVFSVLPQIKNQNLSPFFRYERYDTQQRVPDTYTKNLANSHLDYTVGLSYHPIAKVAIKIDHQWKYTQARTHSDQWNLGIGYVF